MTDRLIASSQELRAEGEELDSEIWRHAHAFYDRICRMQQRLQAELNQLEQMRRKFEWSVPKQAQAMGQQIATEQIVAAAQDRRALAAVKKVQNDG